MEKRVLLAIVLSFLVLYTWSALNPPPKKIQQQSAPFTVVSEMGQSSTGTIPQVDLKENFQEKSDKKEEISTLDSDSLTVELSNLGGTINKLKISKYKGISIG